ncbi:MAG: dihydropteroate synthase [Clostridia bacterium]|nr:dihydropteroate synthase [Clostridia bacterium]
MRDVPRGNVRYLRCGRFTLELGRRTLTMGVLNVTPDSFSDGGCYLEVDAAVARARAMVAEGADIIDVGGESTRPGAVPVPAEEEARRILPVIRALAPELPVPISVDTYKAEVAAAAVAAGASMINDVWGLQRDPDMAATAARLGVPVVVMHNQSEPVYPGDLVASIRAFFAESLRLAAAAGVPREHIILDPGFGFGKTPAHNLEVVARLGEFVDMGLPLLLGPSRKSTIGHVLGLPVQERLEGTVALAVLAAAAGVDIVRVHDVQAAVRALRMADAVVRRPDWGPDGGRLPAAARGGRGLVALRGLAFFGRHGVYAEERRGQLFRVDVELEGDFEAAACSDDLADAADYAGIYEAVRRAVEGEPCRLLETLAARVADEVVAALGARPGAGWLRVRVHKPAAPLPGPFGDVFVELERPWPAGRGESRK